MNVFEFVLTAIGMVIIGVWGLVIIAKWAGLLNEEKKDK